jgi:hypothetical protein
VRSKQAQTFSLSKKRVMTAKKVQKMRKSDEL